MSIELGVVFNQPLVGISWPSALEYLNVGAEFNQRIKNVKWPSGLRQLYFGKRFAQADYGVRWPPTLEELQPGAGCFNSDGSPVRGPPGVRFFGGPIDWQWH